MNIDDLSVSLSYIISTIISLFPEILNKSVLAILSLAIFGLGTKSLTWVLDD
jgi:hypothetical protein